MLNRIRGLFARYADRHLHHEMPGAPLPDHRGQPLGVLETVTVQGNRLRFQGWTVCHRMTVNWPGDRSSLHPHLRREDLETAPGMTEPLGFDVDTPLTAGPYGVELEAGEARVEGLLPCPDAQDLKAARRRLKLRFAGHLAAAAPFALRWYMTHDPAMRARVKSILGLDPTPHTGPLDSDVFLRSDPVLPDPTPITIVLPVYNAFNLLPEALSRVEANTDLPWRLILIEDGSPDARVRPFLRDWAEGKDQVTLIENDTNLGFIRSVNKGLTLAAEWGNHVVLLNSDAFVPKGWASRLLRPILRDPGVATVTPMSNDAEIFSVPAICTRTVLTPGEGDRLDEVARQIDGAEMQRPAPTGVGFCMAMNAAFLARVPALDTSFGRGYGEEVDWCQKVRMLGGRHLGVPNLFVEHRGGESFGSEEKRALVLKNNAIIASRYVDYDREVQAFIQSDPLLTARLALAVGFLAGRAQAPVPIYLAHSLGGGAEFYLQDRIARDLDTLPGVVVIRVGGPKRFKIEIRTEDGGPSGSTDDPDLLRALLAPLTRRNIVYSCAVGDRDGVSLPGLLLSLMGADDTLDVLFHDYFPISPSYCLLDRDGTYRGPVTRDTEDKAHRTRRPNGTIVPLEAWQEVWGKLLSAATRVIVFSQDSRTQVLSAYPDVAASLEVQPHDLLGHIPRIPSATTPETVIGVLGNIGHQKGAGLLGEIASLTARRTDATLVLIGNVDPAYRLPPSVPVHGDYRLEDLATLVARYKVTCWLIPSIWPETFSYTTHECLATGLPVYAFDIGAQGEAVSTAQNGHPVPFTPGPNLARQVLQRIAGDRP